MIDPSLTRIYRLEAPVDVLHRKHRYLVYSSNKRLLCKFYNLSEVYKFINHTNFSRYVVSWQYLGADGYYHLFQREYLYAPDNQLLLF